MNNPARWLAITIAATVLGLAGWNWRLWWPGAAAPPPPAAASGPVAAVPQVPPPTAAASQPVIRHPIGAASAPPLPEPAPSTIATALAALFGNEALATLVRSEGFVANLVATVDNLGREKAPARLWPLVPPAGRFGTRGGEGGEAIAPENFARYARHLAALEKIDAGRLVALYKRLYPQFQQAYEDLGYPGRHFNDRVVEVIDLLLATPEPNGPIAVRQPPIQGPIRPERPWLLYEFADPAWQALPAGQQLLLRMGPDNERRVKAKLRELRRRLAP
ncbi:MAG: DUF3014 domain-containing protein [Rubrivivax sp.]|nr:DUF3014 domain-containing protein [Rubrivivax sp.]